MNRVGIGYDLHRLVEKEDLILGGVKIDHHLGLEGHSDADVLVHALIDAMLGAAALGDIGFHFPPGDYRYHGISSLELLKEARDIIGRERWQVINADTVVVAEKPRLTPYVEAMRSNIAATLAVQPGRISVKATTTERLGACGREEGIAAQAVVLIEKSSHPGRLGRKRSRND